MIVEYWQNGKLKQRTATHEEEIGHTEWHHPDKQCRIILSIESLKTINIKKEFNIGYSQLYDYFKSTDLAKVEVNDTLMLYVDEVFEAHRMLIEAVGGIIEVL